MKSFLSARNRAEDHLSALVGMGCEVKTKDLHSGLVRISYAPGKAGQTQPDIVPQSLARDYFRLSRNTVNVWLARGKLDPVMVYGKKWVRLSDIRRFCHDPNESGDHSI